MAEILLYGTIGEPLDKLDAATVTAAIRSSRGPLTLRINSPGGYVMEGLAIVAALRDYSGKITVYIDGLAASMGSVIAMAGDEIIIAEAALMMIHKPWEVAMGNADDLRADAAMLDRIEQQLIGIYSKRTGLPQSQLAAMLAQETWLTPEQALELGFVSSIAESLKIAAMADVSALGFRNVPDRLKGSNMTVTPPNPITKGPMNQADMATVRALADQHRLGAAVALDIIQSCSNISDARDALLEKLADRSDSERIGFNAQALPKDQTFDNPDFHAKSIGDAIYARMSGKAPEGASTDLMGVSLIDMAREMLDKRGVRNVLRMRPTDVLSHPSIQGSRRGGRDGWLAPKAAITTGTGDFPGLLQEAGQRFLMDQFAAAQSVIKMIARKRTAADFRAITGLQLSGFGVLDQVPEHGELRYGNFAERQESYKLNTFGKLFNLSRQAIVNDDLGAFSDPLTIMARAAAETEATVLAAMINSNVVMADGNAFFSSEHANLDASGAAPSVAELDAGRQAMRGQKGADGTMINAVPKFMLVPTALETVSEVLTATTYSPTTADNANVFAGKLTPLVEPRLTSSTAWYLFGDPAIVPAFEYAYLNGEEGPQTETKEGWDVLGMEFRVVMDFGAGATDWRAGWKNPGA
jgi:ATP-dependent protease ClpP protease subunit